jgi:hypothetical protein
MTHRPLAGIVRELGIPVILLVIALLTIIDGLRIVMSGQQAGQDSQSGFFILALGVAFTLFIIISSPFGQIRRQLQKHPTPTPEEMTAPDEIGADTQTEPATEETPRYMRQVLTAIALIVVWALALPWIGFAITNGLFLTAFMILVGRRKILSSVLLGLIIGIVTAMGFSALGVVLPQGIFGI